MTKIAVLSGDGIGPEIMVEALKRKEREECEFPPTFSAN